MATLIPERPASTPLNDSLTYRNGHDADDVFSSAAGDSSKQLYHHRFSTGFDFDSHDISSTSSPAHVKRAIEAHLQETDRRLFDTQRLGTSLLKQREDLSSRLEEVEQHSDSAQIPEDLRRKLADIEREHEDIGREVARALIGPKQRPEDLDAGESGVYASHTTGSPTKPSAPSRRTRNQPSQRTDLQFAADISTSLLAQVRQLQAAVADRDETIRKANAERENQDRDIVLYTQKLRSLDENEQKYKDENWNLETQNHDLLTSLRDAEDRDKKQKAALASLTAERVRLQNEFDEIRSAHGKLSEEHIAAKKAHDAEVNGHKRNADVADSERQSLQTKIAELISQNEQLAKAVAIRSRVRHSQDYDTNVAENVDLGNAEMPDDSPPPSPTKATPRPGGLESETLRSSLHHAHRMIQNLKGNIHREKTEKIELKRMLQDARDELEQRRSGDAGSAAKKAKRSDTTKKAMRPDMLGGNRRPRTDIEMDDEDWEDHNMDTPSHSRGLGLLQGPRLVPQPSTDLSDAYQTANDTDGQFETADERNTTESEAFMTGAESLAGDSTEELTETEDNSSRFRGQSSHNARHSMATRKAGDRASYLSTASTSADEDDEIKTPIQPAFAKFKLRNARNSQNSAGRNGFEGTPDSIRTTSIAQDSPATVTGRSPPGAEQSLYAELGGLDEMNSDMHSTPARSDIVSHASTPAMPQTPAHPVSNGGFASAIEQRPAMVDAAMMTEAWQPEQNASHSTAWPVAAAAVGAVAGDVLANGAMVNDEEHISRTPELRAASPSDFPLPPSVPVSPQHTMDTSTQYTPGRGLPQTPNRNDNFITPPKTMWDEAYEPSPERQQPVQVVETPPRPSLGYSRVLSQESVPVSAQVPKVQTESLGFSGLLFQGIEPVADPVVAAPVAAAPISVNQRLNEAEPIASETAHDDGLTKERSESPDRPKTVEKAVPAGLFATAAAAFGLSRAGPRQKLTIAEDETSGPVEQTDEAASPSPEPLRDISGNARAQSPTLSEKKQSLERARPVRMISQDSAVQTALTSSDIDAALHAKKAPAPAIVTPVTETPTNRLPTSPTRYSSRPSSRTRDVGTIAEDSAVFDSTTLPPRPNSASSNRASSLTSQTHPPLPSNHKDIIAQASVSSPKKEAHAGKVGGIMGPPSMPASAMRRPKTPSESLRPSTRDSRPPVSGANRGTMGSRASRRSSVSSFASELDERFNIRTDQAAQAAGLDATGGTDPRMIQAITQTMIGEFLWKYTRKAGSKEMSSTRHRRYFWVHPYTKTLYWSDQDPQTGGRKEHRSKSVAIESVRVVSDDNPMPPGLHRKSLEVTAEGRKVKFTASTGQRHETWFNALSYLLHRAEAGSETMAYTTEATNNTTHDINANGYGARLVPNSSRVSMSSYNSRASRSTSVRTQVRQPLPVGYASTDANAQNGVAMNQPESGRQSRAEDAIQMDKDRTIRAKNTSSISKMMRSMTGRSQTDHQNAPVDPADIVDPPSGRGSRTGQSSIYDASVVSDNRNDSESQNGKQETEQNGLEDVRACCDGKHHLSSLSHRHPSHNGSMSGNRLSNAFNRSMSRRA